MDKIGKLLFICAVVFIMLEITTYAGAYDITAYIYDMSISGTFGDTIDPVISNLPDSTYPFPQLRGGSFNGIFSYDSMTFHDPLYQGAPRFPYESVSINIEDNQGSVVKNINTSPNDFYDTSNLIQFTFGPSFGIPNSTEDLRVFLNGSFSAGPVPPPVGQILSGHLNYGFLETDGVRPFTYWDLPISQVTLNLTGTHPYLYNLDKFAKVTTDDPLIVHTVLGQTFSFDYLWQMGINPPPYQQGYQFDVLALQGGSGWQFIGQIDAYEDSTVWQTALLQVPQNLWGQYTDIRFVLTDYYPNTDPTVYLANMSVPEPTTLLLVAAGLIGLVGFRRKFRR